MKPFLAQIRAALFCLLRPFHGYRVAIVRRGRRAAWVAVVKNGPGNDRDARMFWGGAEIIKTFYSEYPA